MFYVYVLEASLAFGNGMTIPLMSEFLSYAEGDWEGNKQDCELKAFKRLAKRIKERFPRLPVLVLLDGLYANGPVVELCRRNRWQFMIVSQDDSLPSVSEEVEGLKKLQPRNRLDRNWGERKQHFWWVNDIEYRYGDHGRKRQTVHIIICEESWEEVDPATAEIVVKRSKHAWLSSEPLRRENVHERCNLGVRHRWGIENNFLVEKRRGYQYEHCFSRSWHAMKGYHFLMRLGHPINILARNTVRLARLVCRMGSAVSSDSCEKPAAGHGWMPSEYGWSWSRPAKSAGNDTGTQVGGNFSECPLAEQVTPLEREAAAGQTETCRDCPDSEGTGSDALHPCPYRTAGGTDSDAACRGVRQR